jgi:hypothetical protein
MQILFIVSIRQAQEISALPLIQTCNGNKETKLIYNGSDPR